ncbi:hypothetical protein H0P11_10825 [Escherichia coli]|uniref:hypothetical protein n=1 Tax=Escherichia coli TaxID=562 RepID=UPI0015D740D8|nr:hypothetical protein [Escherichia coli]EFB3348294.1 hypothetical protein [Escherichia coli]EJH3423813.1 hypothetical protein [Escherichia coli]NZB77988.1 hypothetical protein [Escherichia coli]
MTATRKNRLALRGFILLFLNGFIGSLMKSLDIGAVSKRELLNNFAKCIGGQEAHLILSGQPSGDFFGNENN